MMPINMVFQRLLCVDCFRAVRAVVGEGPLEVDALDVVPQLPTAPDHPEC